jgi:hypothetical protein
MFFNFRVSYECVRSVDGHESLACAFCSFTLPIRGVGTVHYCSFKVTVISGNLVLKRVASSVRFRYK